MARKRRNIVGDTPYQARMRDVLELARKGGYKDANGVSLYDFYPDWLAQQIGGKVTAAFRKAYDKFESEGLLYTYWLPNEAGGTRKAFSVRPPEGRLDGQQRYDLENYHG